VVLGRLVMLRRVLGFCALSQHETTVVLVGCTRTGHGDGVCVDCPDGCSWRLIGAVVDFARAGVARLQQICASHLWAGFFSRDEDTGSHGNAEGLPSLHFNNDMSF
jgi:hypothetical protein